MHVTFDTNVINPLACPDMYKKTCPDMASVNVIRESIRARQIYAYMSEASMSLEAISNDERVDVFFRQWASGTYPIQLPEPSDERKQVFSKAIQLGFRVLHVPRMGLKTFIWFPETVWAEDTSFQLNRYGDYIYSQPDTGVTSIKKLGAELVTIHGLSTAHLAHLVILPSWPTAEEIMWLDGLLAEYDSPMKFTSRTKFLEEFREKVAEWFDTDIQASHYAYGHDYLCTFDCASKAGPSSIMHRDRIAINSKRFGINIVSPNKLVEFVTQNET